MLKTYNLVARFYQLRKIRLFSSTMISVLHTVEVKIHWCLPCNELMKQVAL